MTNRPDPKVSSPQSPGRPVLLIGVLAGVVLLAAAGWLGYRAWDAARAARREAGRVGELHEKLAVKGQPLTDTEFDEALALTATADPEARFVALLTVTAHAQRHRPEWKPRVLPVADRLAGDPEPAVRQKAAQCQAALAPKPSP